MNTETEPTGQTPTGGAVSQPRENLPKFIQEIDAFLGQTFDSMAVIDESYGKISSYFINLSNQVAGERDFDKLSKNEQKEAALYMAAALAVEGVCAVTKGIKETIALERVKALHRQVAEGRRESLPRMIARTQRCHDEAALTLLRYNGHPFRTGQLKQSFKETADLLETELCQYRDLRFRLDMLLWLQDEYEAWMEGRLYSETPMPTMGQATIAAIYLVAGHRAHLNRLSTGEDAAHVIAAAQPPVSATNLKAELRSFAGELSNELDFSRFPSGKDFITAFEILASIDSQMAAVLEYYSFDDDPLAGAKDDDDEIDPDKVTCSRLFAGIYRNADSAQLPQLKEAMDRNSLIGLSMYSLLAFYEMKGKYSSGTILATISGLLICAAAVVPVWALDWSWYWLVALSAVVLLLLVSFVTGPVLNSISRKFQNKYLMMNSNYQYYVTQEAGLTEQKSRLKAMVKARNHFWGGLIVGALIGCIGGPVGAIIGAIVGAMLGSSSTDDVDAHGEGWQQIKLYSPFKQWFLIIIAGFALYLEITNLF